MKKHHLQVWSPVCHNIRQWKAVRQSQVLKFCQDLGVKNHYSSPRHPQANSKIEVTNRSLLKIIKTRLEGAKGHGLKNYQMSFGHIGRPQDFQQEKHHLD